MRARAISLGLTTCVLFPSLSLAMIDGMNLTVSLGTGPSTVNLTWTGGQPSFKVYRSTSANGLVAPGNQIGETSVRAWSDAPGLGGVFYYEITSPCVYAPPEVCDGVDNDCDGTIDGPGSEASCNLPNAVPQCVGGSCVIAACVSGFGDCDTSPADGCESNLSTDVNHCGTCTVSCVDAQACTADSCVASACRHIDLRTCVAAPTTGEGGGSCGGAAPAPGCWGISCTAEVVPLPPGCDNPDSDGDGLPDAWESAHGVDGNCDGDLNDTGAGGSDVVLPDDPDWDEVHQKNAYVYYDWMNKDPSDPAQHQPMDDFIGKDYDGVTDAPVKGTIRRVVEAFAAQGIRLKFEPNVNPSHVTPTNPTGITSPLTHQTVVSFANPIGDCAANGGTNSAVSFYQLKAQNFDSRRKYTHKYAVFGHHVHCFGNCDSAACASESSALGLCSPVKENTTGLAELPGDDSIVTLGDQGLDDGSTLPEPQKTEVRDRLIRYQAGTVMHELGHTFGLDHGGPKSGGSPSCDSSAPSSINRKPNYISSMNYAFQYSGIQTAGATCSDTPLPPNPPYAQLDPGAWRVDYSTNPSPPPPPLDENGLFENEGISSCVCGVTAGPRDISVAYAGCSGLPMPVPGCGPVDWNRNGTIDTFPVAVDINQDSLDDSTKPCPTLTPLDAGDDWSFVKSHLPFQCGGNFSDGASSHSFPGSSELYERMIIDLGLKSIFSREPAPK